MRHTCPVCAYPELPYPPQDFHICPCCGTEFGNDDIDVTHEQLREMWIATGAEWFFRNPPPGWNPYLQLAAVGLASLTPDFFAKLLLEANATVVANEEPPYEDHPTLKGVSIAVAA